MANEDPAYLEFIRSRPCCACGRPAPSEPHHPRHDVGMARRSHDHRAISLCRRCHEDIERFRGAFAGFDKLRVRDWCDAQGKRLRRCYLAVEESDFPR